MIVNKIQLLQKWMMQLHFIMTLIIPSSIFLIVGSLFYSLNNLFIIFFMMNFYLLHSVDTVTCSNLTSASLNQECPLKVGGTEFRLASSP